MTDTPREAAEALIRKGYAQGGSSRPGQSASGGTGGAAAGAPMKRRRWYLGIQSKKDPAHVMTEVYRALLQLGCHGTTTSRAGNGHSAHARPAAATAAVPS
ncbi:unnamed protein product, partial [Ectocarpus sp. 13 AM-2016]